MDRRITTAGLVVFLLVDIVLVYLALRPPAVSTATPAPSTVSTGTPAQGSATSPTPTGSPTTRETESENVEPRPASVLLAGLDADVAWRASVGSCRTGGATLELTIDGGATWDEVDPPVDNIARIQPLGPGRGFLIGGVDGCSQVEFTTEDGGEGWAGPRDLAGAWARKLDAPDEVTTPQEPRSGPCGDQAVLDLSRTSADQAEALCLDGSVRETEDGGVSWRDSGEATGALALANRIEGGVLSTYVARAGIEGCAGVQIAKVVRGQEPTDVACVEVAEIAPGTVALSATSGAGWLVVGSDTWTSGADLTNWERA